MVKIYYADNTYNIFNFDKPDINALIADKRIISKLEVSNEKNAVTTYIPISTEYLK